jgi:hypothetical protein
LRGSAGGDLGVCTLAKNSQRRFRHTGSGHQEEVLIVVHMLRAAAGGFGGIARAKSSRRLLLVG